MRVKVSGRFTIWQCTDWCCELKPHSAKWWNVGLNPGNYHHVRTWRRALNVAATGKLPWS